MSDDSDQSLSSSVQPVVTTHDLYVPLTHEDVQNLEFFKTEVAKSGKPSKVPFVVTKTGGIIFVHFDEGRIFYSFTFPKIFHHNSTFSDFPENQIFTIDLTKMIILMNYFLKFAYYNYRPHNIRVPRLKFNFTDCELQITYLELKTTAEGSHDEELELYELPFTRPHLDELFFTVKTPTEVMQMVEAVTLIPLGVKAKLLSFGSLVESIHLVQKTNIDPHDYDYFTLSVSEHYTDRVFISYGGPNFTTSIALFVEKVFFPAFEKKSFGTNYTIDIKKFTIKETWSTPIVEFDLEKPLRIKFGKLTISVAPMVFEDDDEDTEEEDQDEEDD